MNTLHENSKDISIPTRFEALAARYPHHIAIVDGPRSITYAALNRQANRVAHAVQARLGPQPEPVAFLLASGIEAYAVLLGILKAGKFYVPLDPAHPPARTASIAAHAQFRLIVSDGHHAAHTAALAGDWLDIAEIGKGTSAENPSRPTLPEPYLNITYTSGSTGQPKGVLQTQRNMLHEVHVSTAAFDVTPADRFSQLLSISFGAAAAHTFEALLSGASLHLYNLKRRGVTQLDAWLADHQITLYHSVPTIFRRMLSQLDEDTRFPHLRVIRLGGEPVFERDVIGFQRHFEPGCILRNCLASTEAYLVTCQLVDHATTLDGPLLPVGHPAPGITLHLWDAARQPVAPGTPGEIAIQSRYLAPGYWRNRDQTEARFVSLDGSDERIYVTGDIGRINAAGALEHLGRKDHQVKIHGNRVETAEIEVALLTHSAVREAAVVARERAPGELALVAYLAPTAADGPPLDSADMRAHLAARLPAYMIPALFITLAELPLLPFGKVNRNALPTPDWGSSAPFSPPETPLERQIAAIWANILNVARVGRDDDFFALGGDSLRAGQVLAHLRAELGDELPPAVLFDAPTVAALAERVVAAQLGQLSADDIDTMLAELEGLSDAEIARLLADETSE